MVTSTGCIHVASQEQERVVIITSELLLIKRLGNTETNKSEANKHYLFEWLVITPPTFLGLGAGGGPSRLDSLQLLFGTDSRSHSVSVTREVRCETEYRQRTGAHYVEVMQLST